MFNEKNFQNLKYSVYFTLLRYFSTDSENSENLLKC